MIVIANAANPKSAGVRKWARTIVLIKPRKLTTIPAALTHAVPFSNLPRTFSKTLSKNGDQMLDKIVCPYSMNALRQSGRRFFTINFIGLGCNLRFSLSRY
jgi:hypothetical protein